MQLSKQRFQIKVYKQFCASFIASLLFVFGTSNVNATNIIAPYDAIVCFDTDFSSCVGKSFGSLFGLYQGMFEDNNGKLALHSQITQSPGQNPETSNVYNEQAPPNKPIFYQCHYVSGLSAPPLGLKDKKAIIYISVPIFIALHDNLYRLQQAQGSCHDLIVSFNFEIGQLTARKQLTVIDGAAEYLTNILQAEIYSKEGVGATILSAAQQAAWNVPGAQSASTEADALLRMRQLIPPQRELNKNAVDDNRMLFLAEKFADADRETDFYRREVELNLYLINVGITDLGNRKLTTNVLDDSWVVKGTVVGTVD